ncbi:MAG: hypothetical protein Aurels2KO_39250 [Aureliella sp.]
MSFNKPWKNREYATLKATSAVYLKRSALLPDEEALYGLALSGRARYQQHRAKFGAANYDVARRNVVASDIGLADSTFRKWLSDPRGCQPLGIEAYLGLIDSLGWDANLCREQTMLRASMTRLIPDRLHRLHRGRGLLRNEQISPNEAAMFLWMWSCSDGISDFLHAIECSECPCDVPFEIQERLGEIAVDACFDIDDSARELFGGIPETEIAGYQVLAEFWQRIGLEWVVGFDALDEHGFLDGPVTALPCS